MYVCIQLYKPYFVLSANVVCAYVISASIFMRLYMHTPVHRNNISCSNTHNILSTTSI